MLVSASGKTEQQNLISQERESTSEWDSWLWGERPELLGDLGCEFLCDAYHAFQTNLS